MIFPCVADLLPLSPLLVSTVDSEDGVVTDAPGNLSLDTDFLLGQDLQFDDPDHDSKILGLEKFSGLCSLYPPLLLK